jgi:glycosyltransferase involved in cell wall biosynthesis
MKNINSDSKEELSCSVVIPCHNEAGNISQCLSRIPDMGSFLEIIVVDDGSKDKTVDIVERMMQGDRRINLVSYPKRMGKGHAIREGFSSAHGDVFIILDADMSVSPEELPKFFNFLKAGGADFINGTRMIYKMENGSMDRIRFTANRIFCSMINWLLDTNLTDTLCGTKAFQKEYFQKMHLGKCYWGDFDLLFEAKRLGLKITEQPVNYKSRKSGKSKMNKFKMILQCLHIFLIGIKRFKL